MMKLTSKMKITVRKIRNALLSTLPILANIVEANLMAAPGSTYFKNILSERGKPIFPNKLDTPETASWSLS